VTEAERIHSLRRMKAVATGLLLAATLVFIITRGAQDGRPWVGYVRAFAEAAMIGALADWFAVTALFRHPLGIPIPHTAIIPNRKDQIGRSLGEFVQGEFLNHDVIVDRLESLNVADRIGTWLTDPVNAHRAGNGVADALRGTLEVLDDHDVQGALENLVERRVRATPVAPLVGRAVDLAIEGGHHQRLLDSVLIAVRSFLDDNRAVLREKLDRESPWWVPEPVDDRIFSKIFSGVDSFLAEVAGHPEHEVRHALDARIIAFAQRLRDDPALIAKGEELKEELLAHPDVRAWLATMWAEIKRTLITTSSDPTSELRIRLDNGLVQFGQKLCTDPDLKQKIDTWVERAVAHVVDNYRNEVSDLIASTVERWDADATSRKMELQVGRDLQFIRINGTLVGGLAGLAIHTVGEVFF
jgi:uncharacterized membrane-anchored protein YjiN (DUF445 family)